MTQFCFVIQPFDGGQFDQRYREIYRPAIEKAGLKPYRVDEDPSASIPIEQIVSGIKNATVCFADITLDNPNVWLEVGLAIAYGKDVCLVCSSERTKFPFDVQHRKIIIYTQRSPSDFVKLGDSIVDRLQGIKETQERFVEVADLIVSPALTGNLSDFEIAALGVLMSGGSDIDRIGWFEFGNRMYRQGYTAGAANLAARRLINSKLAERKLIVHENGDEDALMLTTKGWSWIEDNVRLFNLYVGRKEKHAPDDDIPF